MKRTNLREREYYPDQPQRPYQATTETELLSQRGDWVWMTGMSVGAEFQGPA
jgi:hypothetical protein